MNSSYVVVSEDNPRCFEFSDGRPFIPVGLNLCFPRSATNTAEVLDYYQRHINALAEAGGNFIRVWLGAPFFELEPQKEGEFDSEQLKHIAAIVEMAEINDIKIKFTLEHFRTLVPRKEAELFPGAATFVKSVYHVSQGGSLSSMEDFFTSEAGAEIFKRKLDILAKHFKDFPAIMAWELWNEVNCVGDMKLWTAWTEKMLPELKLRFPNHLALQSIGSFGAMSQQRMYDWLGQVSENTFFQAHRYLDPGADLEVCHGPIDILCADVIRELKDKNANKPLILAEAGAVEWRHSAPSHLYENDTMGMILHDVLFAPFFAGAAGPGQCWHWEKYVIRHNLWWHFTRFAKTVSGIDPRWENYRSYMRENAQLRIYCLEGESHFLLWCRDKCNNWVSELEQGQAPEMLKNIHLNIKDLSTASISSATYYSPWTDTTGKMRIINAEMELPDFQRSLVLKLSK